MIPNRRISLFLGFLLTVLIVNLVRGSGATVDIGLLAGKQQTCVIITPLFGDYNIHFDSSEVYHLSNQDLLHLVLENGKITAKTLSGKIGSFSSININPVHPDACLKLKPVIPYGQTRAYDNVIRFSISENAIHIINEVDLDKYVAGVIKSEVGLHATFEYYKLQSIICRTFALSNFRRHEEENFQLCDKVHCQVFGGRCGAEDPATGAKLKGPGDILDAAMQTRGLVLIDTAIELINASFHSNCGGQTVNSEYVWSEPKSYLKSVNDPYCLSQKQANWQKSIPKAKWLSYLEKVYNYPVQDKKMKKKALSFDQKYRLEYFNNDSRIKLVAIRKDWRLRSAFFSVEESGDDVILSGKGFGHGVGLCQEGAMRMSVLGRSYQEILHYYYTNASLIDISTLRFLLK